MKLHVIGGNIGYANWLEPIGYEITQDVYKAEVFMFTGGEDVTPSFYGHECFSGTYYNTRRDEIEKDYFMYALENRIPMIGVCRGSQFLGVMNGAKLIQDMSHPYKHKVKTIDRGIYECNSTHHQSVYLDPVDSSYSLLAWAENLSPFHTIGGGIEIPKNYKETEVTYWKRTRCLGIQSHPEDTLDSKWNTWLQYIVKEYLY